MRRILYIFFFLRFAGTANGQQLAQYSQYMFNRLVLNPAYAGSWDRFTANALYRKQWVGMDGAPSTQTLAFHGPSRNLRHGFGLSICNDMVGVTKDINLTLAYAFRIALNDQTHLALGLQGMADNFRNDLQTLRVRDGNDFIFVGNSVNLILPNAGAGLYLNSNTFYLGASVPRLIESSIEGTGVAGDAKISRHYFLTGGLMLKLGENLKFKPSALLKYVPGTPASVDVNASLLISEKLWVGTSYRHKDAMVFLLELWALPQLRIGYAYDYGLSRLNNYHHGSHEIMLGIDLNSKNKNLVSPRYF